jgi:hypothetical protein
VLKQVQLLLCIEYIDQHCADGGYMPSVQVLLIDLLPLLLPHTQAAEDDVEVVERMGLLARKRAARIQNMEEDPEQEDAVGSENSKALEIVQEDTQGQEKTQGEQGNTITLCIGIDIRRLDLRILEDMCMFCD